MRGKAGKERRGGLTTYNFFVSLPSLMTDREALKQRFWGVFTKLINVYAHIFGIRGFFEIF